MNKKAIKVLEAIGIQARMNALTNTDEQALKVAYLYPEWSGDSVMYKVGDRIRYNDILYKVITEHTSQPTWTPDVSPSMFTKVLIPDPSVIPEWEQPDSTNGYSIGDKVTHNDKMYESLVDNNIWEPGAIGTEAQWKELTE